MHCAGVYWTALDCTGVYWCLLDGTSAGRVDKITETGAGFGFRIFVDCDALTLMFVVCF